MNLKTFNCRAQWITMADDDIPAPLFRKEFEIGKPVSKIICKISGLGAYVLTVDGSRIGDSILEPRFSNYAKTVYYNATELPCLEPGRHTIGVMLGRSRRSMLTENTWGWHTPPWNTKRQLVVQIDVYYENGTFTCIRSDETWKYTYGPVRFDCLYAGEKYDANYEQPCWDEVGFDDSSWSNAVITNEPEGDFVLQESPPIVPVRNILPVSSHMTGRGSRTYEFDENVAGNIRLEASGKRGSKVTIRYGEKINEDMTVDSEYEHIHAPLQEDTYVFKNDSIIEYSPFFSYKGYRYAEVICDEDVRIFGLIGLVYHNALEKRGEFSCSSPMAGKIHENSKRALLSNLHHTPTDTPIYEKNGWTGDAQLTSLVAMYNYDVKELYSTWMRDFADSQMPNGEIPPIIPSPGWGYSTSDFGWEAAKPALPAWDAAYFEILNNLHTFYGCPKLIEAHYSNLVNYLDYLGSTADGYIIRTGLGDWLAPNGEDHSEELLQPDENHLTSTAYYFRMAEILCIFSKILEKQDDTEKYSELAQNIRSAFNGKYLDRDTGIYSSCKGLPFRQTPNVIALAFGLVPEDLVEKTARALAHDISETRAGHLWTGIIGTRYLLDVLTENGYIDLAFSLIECDTYPSWGYWIKNGATSMYESWELDSRSRNHHMYGTVDSWFYEYICGIKPLAPGFSKAAIRPYYPAGLSHASASYHTNLGELSVRWERLPDGIHISIAVPDDMEAVFHNTSDPGGTIKLSSGLNEFIL